MSAPSATNTNDAIDGLEKLEITHTEQAAVGDSTSAAATSNESTSISATTKSSSTTNTKELVTREIALSGDQIAYLDLMRDRYSLGSVDKVARCLVNYARQDGERKFIFATLRCRKCGIKFSKQIKPITLYAHQWKFLDEMKTEYKIDEPKQDGKPLRVLLDFTQEARTKRGMTDAQKAEILNSLEQEIFMKVRCNDALCTHKH